MAASSLDAGVSMGNEANSIRSSIDDKRPASNWRRFVPAPVQDLLRPLHRTYVRWRRSRPVDLGDLRRLSPVDPNWGNRRGSPIDRTYINHFVGEHANDIRGRVLEIADPTYAVRYGRGVTSIDILMAGEGNPGTTIVGDLQDAPHIPDDTFDCAIVTQTLQYIYDTRAALETLRRILAPGGVLIVTAPGLTKISSFDQGTWGEWWHFTSGSLQRLAA